MFKNYNAWEFPPDSNLDQSVLPHVQFLIRELRYHKPHEIAKKKVKC